MTRFERSLALAAASAGVLRANRALISLPLMSLAASAAVLVAVASPVISQGYESSGQLMILGAIALLIVAVVRAFFVAALTSGAVEHFEGGRPSVASTTAAATALFPVVLGWALICWLLSGLMAVISDRVPVVGRLLANVGSAIFGVVTYLSMPVIVVERCGPVQSIRRSGALLQTTWGENLLGQIGFGLYTLALAVPVAIVGWFSYAWIPWIGVVFWVTGFVAVISYVSALDAIYRVALYRYATTNEVPVEFALAGLESAFATRKRRWF